MILCRHCGETWKPGGKWHAPSCPIVTGHYPTLGRKKRAPPGPVEPLAKSWLEDEPPPEAA